MQESISLDRPNLSDAAQSAIREMIVDGQLAAGERLNEVRLASQLGVSRTPLREALNRLVAEEALESRPRLGYFVKPLTPAEFDQLYDIRPLLEPAALRLAGVPPADQIARLEKINHKLARTRNPATAMILDDEWHFTLLEKCPNRVLVDLIRNVAMRTRRYELALMRERKAPAVASDHHERIISALRSGDLDAACEALRRNLAYGKAPILNWLYARDQSLKIRKSV